MMDIMKIISIQYSSYPDDSAGVPNVVHNLHSRLTAKGHEIHLIVSQVREDLPQREKKDGITIYRISGFRSSSAIGKFIKVLLEVRKVIKKF